MTESAHFKIILIIFLLNFQTVCSQSVDFHDRSLQKQIVSLLSNVFLKLDVHHLYVRTCFSGGAGDDAIDSTLMETFLERGYGIFTNLDYLETRNYYRSGLILDVTCPYVKRTLHQISYRHLFKPNIHFILINSTAIKLPPDAHRPSPFLREDVSLKARISSYLAHITCFLDCQFFYSEIYYHRPKYSVHYKFYELYRVKQDTPFQTGLVFYGSNIYNQWLPRRRRHFGGARLRAASVIIEKHDVLPNLAKSRFLNSDYSSTFHYPIIEALAEGLNFTFDLDIFNDYGFVVNGRMSGLVAKLRTGYYDLAATGLIMKSERLDMLYFLADTLQMKTAIMFRQPPLVSVSNIYFVAFSLQVWLCIVACLLLGSLILHIQVTILRNYHAEQYLSQENFADRITFVWAALCQQGMYKKATSASVKLSLFTILLTALFLFYPYSANIISLLQTPSNSIKNLDDLKASPMKILVHDMPYSKYLIEDKNKSTIQSFYHEKIIGDQPGPCGIFVNIEKGMALVQSGLYGFQADVLLSYTEVERKWNDVDKCLLDQVNFLVVPRSAIPVPLTSEYKELFRQFLRWEREIGILHYSRQRYLQPKPKCVNLASSSYLSFGLTEFFPALRVLLYGTMLAWIVFLAEIAYFLTTDHGKLLIKDVKEGCTVNIVTSLEKLVLKRPNTYI